MTDDPKTNHLSQPLRKDARVFYDEFVRVCAEINGRNPDKAITDIGDDGTIVDHLTSPLLGEHVVNPLDTPVMRFIDAQVCENGWGRPCVDYPAAYYDCQSFTTPIPDDIIYDEGYLMPDGTAAPVEGIRQLPHRIATFLHAHAKTNAIAAYFDGVVKLRNLNRENLRLDEGIESLTF
ncbi:MAG: hypothetical protein H6849_02540 [Alphaproteobacteria bacterium]|nr:MAG: hypothetical protein H6849_02540 [Alphaproteobacteria bacterium]